MGREVTHASRVKLAIMATRASWEKSLIWLDLYVLVGSSNSQNLKLFIPKKFKTLGTYSSIRWRQKQDSLGQIVTRTRHTMTMRPLDLKKKCWHNDTATRWRDPPTTHPGDRHYLTCHPHNKTIFPAKQGLALLVDITSARFAIWYDDNSDNNDDNVVFNNLLYHVFLASTRNV